MSKERMVYKKQHILFFVITLLAALPIQSAFDYNGNRAKKGVGVVLTPQSIYYNGLLQSVTSPQLAGYLQQTFGGVPAAPVQAIPGTTYVFPTIGGGNRDVIKGMVLQPDGKIVVGGYTNTGDGLRFAVARFLANGQLDTLFGTGGTAYIPESIIRGSLFVENKGSAVALQSDGKIIVVGGVQETGNLPTRFGIARFLSNGQLDTTFGGYGGAIQGAAFINASIAGHAAFGADDTPTGVVIQPDGKIVVGGYVRDAANRYRFGVARFLSDGRLDDTFGGFPAPAPAGTTYIDQTIAGGNDDNPYAITLLSNGKIVLGGRGNDGLVGNRAVIACFLPDGTLDGTFGNQVGGVPGTTVVPFIVDDLNGQDQINSLVVQSDGKIVAGGKASIDGGAGSSAFMAIRFTANGLLDATFGGFPAPAPQGSTYLPYIAGGVYPEDRATSVLVQPDGKILLGGYVGEGNQTFFGLARLFSTGQLDTTFGGFPAPAQPGTMYLAQTIYVGGAQDQANAMALFSNGMIVLGGYSINNLGTMRYFALAQFANNYTLATYQDEYSAQGGFY